MYVERLALTDFRLYHRLQLEFGQGVNALVGPNASGKTTVLEALSVLALGRSLRGAGDTDMVRREAQGYGLASRVEGRSGSHTVSLVYRAGERGSGRSYALDSHSLERASDFLGRVPLLSFSPDDLALVKGGPAERRRFLDLLLGQTSATYRIHLARYLKTLAQRNALLADLACRKATLRAAEMMLEPWNDSLFLQEGQVRKERAEMVEAIAPLALAAFRDTDGRELSLAYAPDAFDPNRTAEELRRGVTLSGPHRDEVLVSVAGQDARRFASQGQQRSVVLALKLAALEVLEARTEERPVLLLDDVMSELDPGRGAAFMSLLLRGQVLLTTTDPIGLERALGTIRVDDVSWFEVGDGKVEPR